MGPMPRASLQCCCCRSALHQRCEQFVELNRWLLREHRWQEQWCGAAASQLGLGLANAIESFDVAVELPLLFE